MVGHETQKEQNKIVTPWIMEDLVIFKKNMKELFGFFLRFLLISQTIMHGSYLDEIKHIKRSSV